MEKPGTRHEAAPKKSKRKWTYLAKSFEPKVIFLQTSISTEPTQPRRSVESCIPAGRSVGTITY